MKKIFYITAFIVLGLLLGTLLHAAIEIPTLTLITGHFDIYGKGFVWRHWTGIHEIGGGILWFGGALLGFFLGKKFWQVLYVEKRYGTPRW